VETALAEQAYDCCVNPVATGFVERHRFALDSQDCVDW